VLFRSLEDGVPLRAAGFANVNGLFESVSELAGAVEVVRGPGSVLYGSNAVHGLINITTPTPSEVSSMVSFSASTLDRQRGAVRLARGDAEGGVLGAVSLLHEGGWRADAGVDQQKALLRWDTAMGGWRAQTTLALTNLNQETAGFVRGHDAYKDRTLARSNPNPEAFRDAQAARLQSRLTFVGSDQLDIALTPYARWNEMSFMMHFRPDRSREESRHASVGVLATAYYRPRDGVDVVFGADVERTRGDLTETQGRASFGRFVQGVHYDYEVVADTTALYGDVNIELGALWSVQAGARAEYTRFDYDNRGPDGVFGGFLRAADRVDDFTAVTPKLAVLRRIGADSVAYVRYARGARAPQTTDLYRIQSNQLIADAEPETLDSIEAGWRGAHGDLVWDIAVYDMRKEHFFFRDADGFNVSDGETCHRGIEAALSMDVTPRLNLAASATYARHTYAFDRLVTNNATESISDGDDIDTAPRRLANVRVLWRPVDDVELEAEWLHVGRYFADAANTVTYPGHDIINLRGVWDVSDRVSLTATVRNALDAAYAERADFAFGSERYFPGEERALTLGVRAAF